MIRQRVRFALLVAVVLVGAMLMAATTGGGWAYATAPTITGLSPSSGGVGTAVHITGTQLTGATVVQFSGTNASISSVDPGGTYINATVPSFATSGPVTVTTPGGTAASPSSFTVTVGITVSSASPGGTVIVTGSAFGTHELINVSINGSPAGQTASDGGGNWRATLPVPATEPTGALPVIATGASSQRSAAATVSVTVNWAQPGFSARHRGYNPLETIINSGNVPQLDVDWQTSPVGFVYASGPPLVYGSTIVDRMSNGTVQGLSQSTGTTLWSYTPPGTVGTLGPLAVSIGVAYAGTSNGYLVAINTSNGAAYFPPVCVTTCSSPQLATSDVAPAIANGLVYLLDHNNGIHTQSLSNGSSVSNNYSAASCSPPIGPPAINALTVDTESTSTFCLAYPYGSSTWFNNASGYSGGPSVDQGHSFAAAANFLGERDSFGNPGWSAAPSGTPIGPPAVGDGYVIAPLGKSLLYYQQTTGSLVRSAGLFESAVGPAVIANYVVFVPEQNNVEAFDVYGDLLWRGQAPSVTGLAIANGQLDVSTSAGIVAFDLAGATK